MKRSRLFANATIAVLVTVMPAMGPRVARADADPPIATSSAIPTTQHLTPVVTAEITPVPSPTSTISSVSDTITGSGAGSFMFHVASVPENEQIRVTLVQTNPPCVPGRRDGERDGAFYAEAFFGQPPSITVEVSACTQELTFQTQNGEGRFRVVNYLPATSVSYRLEISKGAFESR